VFDDVIEDVREERIVREVVGVPVAFGVLDGVTMDTHDRIAYTPLFEYGAHAPYTYEMFVDSIIH
jgi:hypothetical protein